VGRRAREKGGMFENEGRVLLVLSRDVLDQTRVLAGKATVALKLPVSLQIVLRALLEVGLQAEHHSALLAKIEGQAKAVHQRRRLGGRAVAVGKREDVPPGDRRVAAGRARR
jgi:hypothetical protein